MNAYAFQSKEYKQRSVPPCGERRILYEKKKIFSVYVQVSLQTIADNKLDAICEKFSEPLISLHILKF